jgi:hypothetical protein
LSGYWRETKGKKSVKNNYEAPKAKETVQEVSQYSCRDWTEAGIRKETLDFFKCKTANREDTGELGAIYFPCWSKDGKKIVGYQKKDLTIDKEEPFHFTAVGSVRNTCMLYGQKQCQHGGKKLIITEGPKDMLSAWQALKDSVRGTKWEKINPNVCSIVNGCSNADKSIAHNEEFVRSFQQVVIAMDNDEKNPLESENVIRGKEAENLIGSYLSTDNLLVPNYPDNRNDLNEILIEDGPKALNDLLLWNVKPFQAEKVITFDTVMTFDEATAPVETGIMFDGFPKLNEALLGLRSHELTTITGLSGTGKSYFSFELCYQCVQQGYKVGLIMLEDPIKKTQQRISARHLRVNPKNYFLNPRACGKTEEELKEAWEFSTNPDNFIALGHFGSIPTKILMSKIKSLTASGCDIILLDHATLCVSGLQTNDERKDLDILYTELAAFRAAHPIHLICVAHVDKKAGSQELGRPTEPKWNHLNMYSLRGSSSLSQLSCNVILLNNEILPSGKRGRVKLTLGKNRSVGELGDLDIVMADWKDGTFRDASDWVYDKEKGIMVPPDKLQGY